MRFLKSFVLWVSLLGIVFPVNVFGQSGEQTSPNPSVTKEEITQKLSHSNKAMEKMGIEFYGANGKKGNLLSALKSVSRDENPIVELLIPSNPTLGLKKALGLKIQRVSLNADGANLHVAYTDEHFLKELVYDNIPYNFHLDGAKNAALTNIILNKMTRFLPSDYAETNAANSALQKTLGLFLPTAHADSSITVGQMVLGIATITIGAALIIWTVRTAGRVDGAMAGGIFMIGGCFLVLGLLVIEPLYDSLLNHEVKLK